MSQKLDTLQNERIDISSRIDQWWDIICNAIQTAARRRLPKKKILNTAKNKRKKTKETKLSKVLTQLGRWISIGRINIKIGLVKENIEELNLELQYIN